MIDLSSQPQDKGSDATDLHPAPRHDPLPGDQASKEADRAAWWQSSHERAEAGVQLLSRWAGPAALVMALGLIGWLLFG